jgi:signal transduction histidine kinase
VIAAAGWALALAALVACVRLCRRLELVADAEHELRGPLTAVALAVEAGAGREAVESELERARAALADLNAARDGWRTPPRPRRLALERVVAGAASAWDAAARTAGGRVDLDWRAGPVSVRADRRRLAQAFGNLLANAVEHGGAEVRLRGVRAGRAVRVEVIDRGQGFGAAGRPGSGRGRGLAIAARAVEDAGGSLRVAGTEGGGRVAVELPLADR